jgi:ribonuclease R
MTTIKDKIIINEFGNGFVNTIDKNNNALSIYIKKTDINRAFNNEIVEVEYYQNEDDLKYYGKVINYTLVDKSFIGFVHHIYKKEAFIYVQELKKSNLISIKFTTSKLAHQLTKNTWVKVKVIIEEKIEETDRYKLIGQLIETIEPDVDLLIEKKFNLEIQNESISSNLENQNKSNSSNLENQNHTDLQQPKLFERKDQRHLNTITIDPITCRDCDDAFSIEPSDKNNDEINIYVHISDVAHYINPDNQSNNFDEIIKKGNTFYGKNKNWTMIPRIYADNYCSILPNKETYVVTNHFIYNKTEKTLKSAGWFYSTIISKNKYWYEYVDENFESNPDFQLIYETSQIIKKEMNDFIITKESKSHEMIRYWMVKTNQVMCKEIGRIFRTNPEPTEQKLFLIKEYIKLINGEKENENNEPLNREKIITFFENTISSNKENENDENNENDLLCFLIKNILPKAIYTETNEFHYGLGIDNYTHWTSPIRRAADLLNHCILKGYQIDVGQYLEYINEAELKQDMIEKFIMEFDNTQTLQVGDEFDAVIIGLHKAGIIVYIDYLDNRYSIHISRIISNEDEKNKRFLYDNETQIIISEDGETSFCLFQTIKTKLTKISLDKLEFTVVSEK